MSLFKKEEEEKLLSIFEFSLLFQVSVAQLHVAFKTVKLCQQRCAFTNYISLQSVSPGPSTFCCWAFVLFWQGQSCWFVFPLYWFGSGGNCGRKQTPVIDSASVGQVGLSYPPNNVFSWNLIGASWSCNFHAFFLWKVVWWAKLDWGPCCRLYKGICPPQVMPICSVRNGAWTVSPRRKLRCSREASFALVGKIAGGLSLSFCKALFFLLINKDFH